MEQGNVPTFDMYDLTPDGEVQLRYSANGDRHREINSPYQKFDHADDLHMNFMAFKNERDDIDFEDTGIFVHQKSKDVHIQENLEERLKDERLASLLRIDMRIDSKGAVDIRNDKQVKHVVNQTAKVGELSGYDYNSKGAQRSVQSAGNNVSVDTYKTKSSFQETIGGEQSAHDQASAKRITGSISYTKKIIETIEKFKEKLLKEHKMQVLSMENVDTNSQESHKNARKLLNINLDNSNYDDGLQESHENDKKELIAISKEKEKALDRKTNVSGKENDASDTEKVSTGVKESKSIHLGDGMNISATEVASPVQKNESVTKRPTMKKPSGGYIPDPPTNTW